jgi:ISXO2-like transposase domain
VFESAPPPGVPASRRNAWQGASSWLVPKLSSRSGVGGVKDNTAAMVAVQSMPGRKLGRVRVQVSPLAPGSAALVEFAQRTIAPGSTIGTDGARHLRALSDLGYQHEYFVGPTSTPPAHVFLPGVHMVASLLKRWLTGTTPHPRATWTTTWTSTPSVSTGAPPKPEACCSTACSNKQLVRTPTP